MTAGEPDALGYEHRPVMVAEVTDLFGPVPAGRVVDATIGGGGHARSILEAHAHLQVVGLDRDADALAAAAASLHDFAGRVELRRARFDRMRAICGELGHERVSGVLFDLGVSSPQLDRPRRGFSYRGEGPLDMRMDQDQSVTADDIVNGYSEERLAAVLSELGEERFARRIARAVVGARPLATTTELADVVRQAIPAAARRKGGHPAKRSFQAIRIEVNGELAMLAGAIDEAIDLLAPEGRAVVLAYHSGEDRIVKARFADAATGGCTCPPRLPCVCGARPRVRHLRRGRRPGAAEIAVNRRAESARLRAVEKLSDTEHLGDTEKLGDTEAEVA